jgi:hypothetical protein
MWHIKNKILQYYIGPTPVKKIPWHLGAAESAVFLHRADAGGAHGTTLFPHPKWRATGVSVGGPVVLMRSTMVARPPVAVLCDDMMEFVPCKA